MRDHLFKGVRGCYVIHIYRSAIKSVYKHLRMGCAAVIPRRSTDAIASSWVNHGKDLYDFDGRSLWDWIGDQEKIAACFPNQCYWIDLDQFDIRDTQISQINHELGLELDPEGWPIVRQADE